MIPKIIHYVWIGNSSKPEILNQCLQTWKQYCPDYKIMEWGNGCIDSLNNTYMQEAYDTRKWAFVSDYIRLYALDKFGGFYFDADLQITKPLDEFLDLRFITGFEKYNQKISPITAFLASEKNNYIVKDLLAMYDGIRFINDGVYDLTTNTSRISKYFQENFELPKNHKGRKLFILDKKCHIYPYFYFCSPVPNESNYAIHHFEGSWIEPVRRKNLLCICKLKLVKFSYKRNLDIENEQIVLDENERLIYSTPIKNRRGNRLYCIVLNE